MKRAIRVVATLSLLLIAPAVHAAETIGIVLMHGKQGAPLGTSSPNSSAPPIGGRLIADLKSAGYLVVAPEMCWSRRRGLDKTLDDCLAEIDAEIDNLRGQGATAFVVGGLSQGGNAAIAYGATHPALLGVIAMAPADDPTAKVARPDVRAALTKAQRFAADGKGSERTTFDDINTGPGGTVAITLNTTPDIYLSFYGPSARTRIPANTAKLPAPLLWVAGDSDPSQRGGPGFAFDKAPPNPLNRYVTVPATHTGTPDAGRSAVLSWLTDLANR
jgi:pimeloyl-ACP methyl ester carboxylesterase